MKEQRTQEKSFNLRCLIVRLRVNIKCLKTTSSYICANWLQGNSEGMVIVAADMKLLNNQAKESLCSLIEREFRKAQSRLA